MESRAQDLLAGQVSRESTAAVSAAIISVEIQKTADLLTWLKARWQLIQLIQPHTK